MFIDNLSKRTKIVYGLGGIIVVSALAIIGYLAVIGDFGLFAGTEYGSVKGNITCESKCGKPSGYTVVLGFVDDYINPLQAKADNLGNYFFKKVPLYEKVKYIKVEGKCPQGSDSAFGLCGDQDENLFELTAGNSVVTQNLSVKGESGQVTVEVKSGSQSVAEAIISWNDADGNPVSAETDSAGSLKIPYVPVGTFKVSASKDGASGENSIQVSACENNIMTVYLQ